jgi:hypothetical protein
MMRFRPRQFGQQGRRREASSSSSWRGHPGWSSDERQQSGGQRRWDTTVHRSRRHASRRQAHTWASSRKRGGDGWPTRRWQFGRCCHAGEQRRGIWWEERTDRRALSVSDDGVGNDNGLLEREIGLGGTVVLVRP